MRRRYSPGPAAARAGSADSPRPPGARGSRQSDGQHGPSRPTGGPWEQRNNASALEDPEGRGPRFFFQRVPEEKVAKNRMHVDVRAAAGLDGDERMAALEKECARLLALGGARLARHEPDGAMSAGFTVRADP